jgi:hypothetical protein
MGCQRPPAAPLPGNGKKIIEGLGAISRAPAKHAVIVKAAACELGDGEKPLLPLLDNAHGKSVNLARKTAMPICALSVVPIVFAYRIESLWGAVLRLNKPPVD